MGLKPISPEEAKQIQAQKGPDPGTTALVFPATRNRKENYTRVDDRFESRAADQAAPDSFGGRTARPRSRRPSPASTRSIPPDPRRPDPAKETCYLPEKLRARLEARSVQKLDVTLLEVTLNQFDPARERPCSSSRELDGYKRRNLAELSRGRRPRTNHPADDARRRPNRRRLGRPAPMSDDDLVVPNARRERRTVSRALRRPCPVPPLEALVELPCRHRRSRRVPRRPWRIPVPPLGLRSSAERPIRSRPRRRPGAVRTSA